MFGKVLVAESSTNTPNRGTINANLDRQDAVIGVVQVVVNALNAMFKQLRARRVVVPEQGQPLETRPHQVNQGPPPADDDQRQAPPPPPYHDEENNRSHQRGRSPNPMQNRSGLRARDEQQQRESYKPI